MEQMNQMISPPQRPGGTTCWLVTKQFDVRVLGSGNVFFANTFNYGTIQMFSV